MQNSTHKRRFRADNVSIFLRSICFFLLCGLAYSQSTTTGGISGRITDSSGAVIPDATVTLKSEESGLQRSVRSSDAGEFRFPQLQPGRYQVEGSAKGLESSKSDAVVAVGQTQNVNLMLSPSAAQTTISVSDAAPVLDTENANLSTSFSAQQIRDLPLPGGDTTTVAFTAPGVVVSTGAGYGNFSSHGLPATANLFTTNGNDNMDPYFNINNSGASNLTLGANELADATVVQNGYSGQYGRQAGAQVNYTTKTGTNSFHGNLVENYNDAIMNANDFFNNQNGTPRGRAVSNQYAASLGGPIKKNKLFFFADTEGIRYVLPTAGTVAIPSTQLENYILGTLPSNQVPLYTKAFNLYNTAPGIGRAQNVTNGDGSLQDSSGNLGCGALAGTAVPGGGTFGVDTPCARSFGTNVTNLNTEWLLSTRVDWNLTDKHRMFFYYKTDHGVQATGTDPINSAFNSDSIQPSHQGQFNYNYAITPNVVNNLIASASWSSALFGPTDPAATVNTFPTRFQISDGGANGAGGFTNLGLATNLPQGRRTGQFELVDDLSWVKGRHSIKVGVNYLHNRVTDLANEELSLTSAYILNGLDEFAAGAINPTSGSFYEQRFANTLVNHLRFTTVGFYAEDEWAVTPNFKATLTMRFDRTQSPTCVDKCFATLNNTFQAIQKGANIPYNQSITTGNESAFKNVEAIVPEPRLAIAWTPGGGKTVIRAGAGIFTNQFPGAFLPSIFQNSPNVFTPSIRLGTINTGGAGSAPGIASATNAAFQQGFAHGYTVSQITAALAPVAFTAPNYTVLPDRLVNPKVEEWNFDVQRQLDSKDVLTLSYVGNHGYNLFVENYLTNGYNARGFAGLPTTAPDPRFRRVTDINNGAVSNYNGLTASFRRALGRGFTGQASYTWSHSLDEESNGGLGLVYSGDSLLRQLNPFSLKALNYGNSDYDIRHNFTADFSWNIPYKIHNAIANAVLGGWTIAGKFYARTGTPFSVYDSRLGGVVSPNFTGTTGNSSLLGTVINPAINTNCTSVNQACFSSSDFQPSGKETGFGNLSRNSFRAPGYFDIDSSVYKRIPIRENAYFQFGASAYNLMNHPQFGSPGSNLASSGVGVISSTVSPPSSAYGSFQGSAVSGRVLVVSGRFQF